MPHCKLPIAVNAASKQDDPPHVASFMPITVVQSLSRVWLFLTTWTAVYQASLSFTISQSLLKFMSIKSVMLHNHLSLCRPLLFLPSVFPSISLFQWVSSSHQVAKVLEFQLQHYAFQLIFFSIDWFDLLEVQGNLKILRQHHSSKASVLWHLAFFMAQLSQPLRDYQKNRSFDYMDLCLQSDVFAF